MTRCVMWTWLMLCLLGGVAWARQGIVKTTDGQTYEGEIDDKDVNTVSVTVKGIQNRIERSRVASIEYADDYTKVFNEALAKLGPADVDGRLALAREAMRQKQYLLARQAAESALQVDPNSADAVALIENIRSQLRLDAAKTRPAEPARAATTTPATQPVGNIKLLSPEQINAIRQAELRPEDVGVRINIDIDLKKRFATLTGRRPQELNAMKTPELAALILKEGTPEMRKDVKILSDPPSMMQYRTRVQPFVLQSCATSGCHNARTAQKFALIEPADSEADTYTNFYMLQNFAQQVKTTDDNVFGGGEVRMIDRQSPEESLLVQYAMPAAVAKYDHPEVRDLRPALRGPTDPRYKLVFDWISNSLSPIDPAYGFDAQPNSTATAHATTQPTTAPTTEPGKPAPTTHPTVRPIAPTHPAPGVPPTPRPVR